MSAREPQWNLYAKIIDGVVQQLLLPDESTLSLPPEPAGEHWYAVQWPVNPHFTGDRMIRQMIEQSWGSRSPVAH